MAEIIRFIPKSERERTRLIREARAIYDSIFPPADPVSAQQGKTLARHSIGDASAYRNEGVVLS
jgi:hypothetical protein